MMHNIRMTDKDKDNERGWFGSCFGTSIQENIAVCKVNCYEMD